MNATRLVVSDDEWLASERLEQLLKREHAGAGVEVVTLEAEQSGIPGLLETIGAQSLFATDRVIVVRGAERLQAAGAKQLAEVAGRAGPGVALVVVAVSDRPPTTLIKALQPVAKLERLSRPKRGELIGWVGQRFRQAGVHAAREVPGLVVETVGTGLRDLAQAVDQLALRAGRGAAVSADDVRRAFSGLAEQPVWALYDALLARDGRRAYRVLHALLEQGNDPIGVLFALVAQNRHVMRAKGVLERSPGVSESQLASAIAVSPARASVLRKQAGNVSWEWMVRLHHECAAADFDLKGGDDVRIVGLLPPEIILERLLDRALPAIELIRG